MSKQKKLKRKLLDEFALAESSQNKVISKKTKQNESVQSELDLVGSVDKPNDVVQGKKSNQNGRKQIKKKKNQNIPRALNKNAVMPRVFSKKPKVNNKVKITPIIQTRAMKEKAAVKVKTKTPVVSNLNKLSDEAIDTGKELAFLNRIDTLTSDEIVGGNVESDDDEGVYHDGVELSIQGSDVDDDFPEVSTADETRGNNTKHHDEP